MTVTTYIVSFVCLLPFIAWPISASISSKSFIPSSPAIIEELAPIIQQIYEAEDAHESGQPEAAIESLRSAFTDFKSEFGDGPREAIQVLTSFLLGNEADNLALASQPNSSKTKAKSNQLGQLWYDVAKEVFGPWHIYTISVLQSLAVRLYNQGQLDKSLELHVALVKILRKQINITSQSESKPQPVLFTPQDGKLDELDDSQTLSMVLIQTLDNVRMLHLTNKEWKKALEADKEMYGLYKHFVDPSSKSVRQSLERIMALYRLIQAQDLDKDQTRYFQQVTQVFHPDLSSLIKEESQKIEEAYGIANQMTKPTPSRTFSVYIQLLGVKLTITSEMGDVLETQFEKEPAPLKYDENVYEFFFVILRLLRSSASLRAPDPEYEEFRETLADLKEDDDDEDDENENDDPKLPPSFLEEGRPLARAQIQDAVEQGQVLLTKVGVKFGKTDRRTKGGAEIIYNLYAQVGMKKEAEEVRKRFGLSNEHIKKEL